MTQAFRVGSLAQDGTTGLVKCFATAAGTSNYMSFETVLNSDYQITAGKTFILTRIYSNSSVAASAFYIGYADNGVPTGVGAPTNPIIVSQTIRMAAAAVTYPLNVLIQMPAGKFPFVFSVANDIGITFEGVEI